MIGYVPPTSGDVGEETETVTTPEFEFEVCVNPFGVLTIERVVEVSEYEIGAFLRLIDAELPAYTFKDAGHAIG